MQRRCITLVALFALLLSLSLLVTQAHAASVPITPAGAFTDNNGNTIQAHEGGYPDTSTNNNTHTNAGTYLYPYNRGGPVQCIT